MTFKFRPLTPKEEADFRRWARNNYEELTPINGVWHPVVQDECAKINAERGLSLPGLVVIDESICTPEPLEEINGHCCFTCEASRAGFPPGVMWPAAVMFRGDSLVLTHRELAHGEVLFFLYRGERNTLTIFND